MPADLVTYVVQNLVEEPDAVEVIAERGEQGVTIEIRCSEGDAGRIIGRGGRVINSLRTLARAAADGRQRVELHLIE